jgi:hypothetical protein
MLSFFFLKLHTLLNREEREKANRSSCMCSAAGGGGTFSGAGAALFVAAPDPRRQI